jgi:hypothetical protein
MLRKTPFVFSPPATLVARPVGLPGGPHGRGGGRRGAVPAPVLRPALRVLGVPPCPGGRSVFPAPVGLPGPGPLPLVRDDGRPAAADGGHPPGAFPGVPEGRVGVPGIAPGPLPTPPRAHADGPLDPRGVRANPPAPARRLARPGRPDRAGGVDGAGPQAVRPGPGRVGGQDVLARRLPAVHRQERGPDGGELRQDRAAPGLVQRPHARRDAGLRPAGQASPPRPVAPADRAAAVPGTHGPSVPDGGPEAVGVGTGCHVPGRDSLLGAAGPRGWAGTGRERHPTDGGEGIFPPRVWGESSPRPIRNLRVGRQPVHFVRRRVFDASCIWGNEL